MEKGLFSDRVGGISYSLFPKHRSGVGATTIQLEESRFDLDPPLLYENRNKNIRGHPLFLWKRRRALIILSRSSRHGYEHDERWNHY